MITESSGYCRYDQAIKWFAVVYARTRQRLDVTCCVMKSHRLLSELPVKSEEELLLAFGHVLSAEQLMQRGEFEPAGREILALMRRLLQQRSRETEEAPSCKGCPA